MSTLERMAAILPAGTFVEAHAEKAKDGTLTLELEAEALTQALPRLAAEAGFETITFVTAMDHMDAELLCRVVDHISGLERVGAVDYHVVASKNRLSVLIGQSGIDGDYLDLGV